MAKITKKALKGFVRNMLAENEKWALRALLVIYSFQTDVEKTSETTVEHNEMGFTAFDAEFLSSLASQYLDRGYLSSKQILFLKKKITKYWSQILAVSDRGKLERAYLQSCNV